MSDQAEAPETQAGTVRVLATGAGARLVLTGEVDIGMNPELYTAALELERLGLPIEVDTRDVTYMDSAVVAVLASLAYRSEHRITVVDPPDVVTFLLRVTELDGAVDVVHRSTAPRAGEGAGREPSPRPRQPGCLCSACRAERDERPVGQPGTHPQPLAADPGTVGGVPT